MEYTMLTTLYRNGRIAIQLMEDDGESYGMLSCNVEDVQIDQDMITVPVWNLSEKLLSDAIMTGCFEQTGYSVWTGHVAAPLWRVVCPTLLAQAAELRSRTEDSAS